MFFLLLENNKHEYALKQTWTLSQKPYIRILWKERLSNKEEISGFFKRIIFGLSYKSVIFIENAQLQMKIFSGTRKLILEKQNIVVC